jgi:hypothetical protein
MKTKNYILLFGYHLLFIIYAYQLRVSKGISDAHLYWGKTLDLDQYSWLDFADYGTNFVLFLNYPFIKLGLPFWFGFLLYGTIGFLGIVKWIQWSSLLLKDTLTYKGFNFLYLIFLLPNLHVWTASLGKEALIFFGIAAVFYAITTQKYVTFTTILGSLMVLIIRPHVALMLCAAIGLIYLFRKDLALKRRMVFATVFLVMGLGLLYMVFQLSAIRYWDWNRITYFNQYSVLSFRHSGSYVPMLEYNYFYQWFSFQFRPLFFDADTLVMTLASIENSIILVLFIVALFFGLRFYQKINFNTTMKTVFLFTFIASVIYIERYANLGIFMRTKMMFQPFMIIVLVLIIQQGVTVMKQKKND